MTRKPVVRIIFSILILFFMPSLGISADYQSMTTLELSELRGTMYNSTQEERDAFRAEWTRRVNQMTSEEKEKYLGPGGGMGQGNRAGTGLGDGQGKGRGGGSGNMNSNSGRQGSGQGRGQGNGPGAGAGGGRK